MEYISEEQQVEQIKKWWAENGNSIIIGIVLSVSGIIGWRVWGDHQMEQSAMASNNFEMVLQAIESKDFTKAQDLSNLIINDFGSTPYEPYAQLSLAKIQFEQKDYAKAVTTLKAFIADHTEDSLEFIARKRLASVYIDQQDYAEALTTLSVKYPNSFQATFEELKGDVYRLQGDPKKAKTAYTLAKVATPSSENPQFLQQKLDNLGL